MYFAIEFLQINSFFFTKKRHIVLNRHFKNNVFFLLLYRRFQLFNVFVQLRYFIDISFHKVWLWALEGTKWFLKVCFGVFFVFFF